MKIFRGKYFFVLLLLAGMLIAINLFNFSNAIKNSFYSFSLRAEKTFWSAGDNISDFLAGFFNASGLRKDLERIALENLQLTRRIAELSQIREENLELREVLGLGLEKEFELSKADVVGKDGFGDSVLLNKGRKDGIDKGLPVITSQKVLVGKIGEVYDDFSEVVLITDQDFSFDAKIFEKDIYGLIKGEGGENISFRLIPKDKNVSSGDLVTTSDLGGIFPKGLLVGKVGVVQKSDIETFQTAACRPLFKTAELKSIFIIKDF